MPSFPPSGLCFFSNRKNIPRTLAASEMQLDARMNLSGPWLRSAPKEVQPQSIVTLGVASRGFWLEECQWQGLPHITVI